MSERLLEGRRAKVFSFILLLLFLCVILRMAQLTLLQGPALSARAEAQRVPSGDLLGAASDDNAAEREQAEPADDAAEPVQDLSAEATCLGSYSLANGHVITCNAGQGHDEVNLASALARSCNCYFVQLGQSLGGPLLRDYAARCGLTELQVIGYDVPPYESRDFLNFADDSQADLANLSLGESVVQLSVIQEAVLTSICVNGGFRVFPRLGTGVFDAAEQAVQAYEGRIPQRVVSTVTAETLRHMLIDAVTSGTAGALRDSSLSAGGKTGSSETGGVWFSGFAPAEQPQWVIAIYVENGSFGGVEAAAVFREVLDDLALLAGRV